MNKGKGIIGILIICVSIVSLVSWEKWGKEKFLYEEIPVFKDDVEKGTLITADMIKYITWPKKDDTAINEGAVDTIVGLIATHDIKNGNPLYQDYFQKSSLTPSGGDDSYVLQISKDWIESCPLAIDKLDRVYLFSNGKFITKCVVEGALDEEKGFNVIASSKQISAISKLINNGNKFVISYDEGV